MKNKTTTSSLSNRDHSKGSVIKRTLLSAAVAPAVVLTGMLVVPAAAAQGHSKSFSMIVSPGAANCLPNASGQVTVSSLGPVENLHVEVFDLRPNTDYDLFIIQVPNRLSYNVAVIRQHLPLCMKLPHDIFR